MSDDPQVTNLTVSGGAGSAEASMEDLLTLSGLHMGLSAHLQDLASQVAGIASDADLFAAALLDPAGIATVHGMLTDALVGRIGLHTMADTIAEHAEQVQDVHDLTVRGDAQQAAIMDGVNWFLGATGLAITGMTVEYVGRSVFEEFTGGPGFDDPVPWILAHPGFMDRWGPTLPALLRMPPGMSFQDTAGMITSFWPDGEPKATRNYHPDPTYLAQEAPTGVGDLMTNLGLRNQKAEAGNDEIDIQRIVQPDNTVAYIVNIPGTKDMGVPLPGQLPPHSNDMLTNLIGVAGEQSTREEAIAMALEQAGVPHDAPIMLVGHSQGGIIAAQAAADTANGTFDYNVTHVVTAASPVALADIPDDIQVLSLENRNDLIPQSDVEANTPTANHTTVSFDYDDHDVGLNHALERSYQQAADMLDDQGSNASPSVTAFMDSASDFLADTSGDTTIETYVFDLERVP